MDDLLSRLRAIVGIQHVVTRADRPNDLTAYEQDQRKRYHGHALAVVSPANTAEVAAVVQVCATHKTSLVPQGGNTGLVVGGVPDTSGTQVVLSLRRLNQIRNIDPANSSLTAEAGCILAHAQDAASQAGLLLPLSLASEGSCTIGGTLATNAGGTQVLRYGNARGLCLGLEVVTPQGEIWNGLSGLRKDNTGYDLRDLYIGSEGTLGVITAATLQLFPRPVSQWTAWVGVSSIQGAVDLLGLGKQQLGADLTGFEVMGQFALSLVNRHFPQWPIPLWRDHPYCVLLENSDFESATRAEQRMHTLLASAQAQGLVTDGVVAQNLTQSRELWRLRESISGAQSAEGLNIKHDISLPISQIPAFCLQTDALLKRRIPGVRLVSFGHLGDGNLHYNVQAPEQFDPVRFLHEHETTVNAWVFESVKQFGGSICAEHGVGSLKAQALLNYKDPVALQLMRRIKTALDPQGLFNPGRVLHIPPSDSRETIP